MSRKQYTLAEARIAVREDFSKQCQIASGRSTNGPAMRIAYNELQMELEASREAIKNGKSGDPDGRGAYASGNGSTKAVSTEIPR